MTDSLPRYDWHRSYEWNFHAAPDPVNLEISQISGDWNFCGLPVMSPFGVPAGPLLNGRWCLYYASLGFDILTYKTVRSQERACYDLPNLLPVECGSISGGERGLRESPEMSDSWAVSFGMPSRNPNFWRRDIAETREQMASGKLLAVSVVGTIESGWGIEELAADYALCARWAKESGADVIETNFSCPNVSTCDGQLYQMPEDARIVAQCVREAIGETPYLIKVGHVASVEATQALVESVADIADGLAMTNSIAATVTQDGHPAFDGQPRGICGKAILAESIAQVARFRTIIDRTQESLQIAAVGGISDVSDIQQYWQAGASSFHIATAAMLRPTVVLEIRRQIEGVAEFLAPK